MVHTRPLSKIATNADAQTRGTTRRFTGSTPITSRAAISSWMVREPRSAQIAVAPAPATISTVTIGPICVIVPNAALAPLRSAAPISRSRMLRMKVTSTVNGIATSTVGKVDTRAMNHTWSMNSRTCTGREKV